MSQSVTLEWKNINKYIDLTLDTTSKLKNELFSKKQTPFQKQILFNVNGHANRGDIVGLIGPSGSGNTSKI